MNNRNFFQKLQRYYQTLPAKRIRRKRPTHVFIPKPVLLRGDMLQFCFGVFSVTETHALLLTSRQFTPMTYQEAPEIRGSR